MKKFLLIACLLAAFTISRAQTVKQDGVDVDFRIYLDHSQTEVAALVKNNPAEIKRLNYYYENSYLIVPSTVPGAPPVDLSTINVKRFEDQRLDNERKTITISVNEDKLILKSKKELEQEYNSLGK